MVNEGWDFDRLLAMSCEEFAFWLGEQEAWLKRQNEAEGKNG